LVESLVERQHDATKYCISYLRFVIATCSAVTVNGKTSKDTVDVTASVSPGTAPRALAQSGGLYQASGDPTKFITLTMFIKSLTTARVTSISYMVQGADVTYYELSYGASTVTSKTRTLQRNVKTTISESQPVPVEADKIIIYLRPTSQYTAVQVSGLFAKVCFGPGM